MESPWAMFALAGALVVLSLAMVLPVVWRGVGAQPAGSPARRRAWTTTLLLSVGLPALAFGFYALRGDPGALTSNRDSLSEQLLQQGLPAPGEDADRLHAELMRHLAKQPQDHRAWVLKARLDLRAERFDEAAAAYARAMAGRSKVVNDAGVWVEYAEAVGMAQGRRLEGEPTRLVHKALELDPRHAQALDLAGSAAWELGDHALAARYWMRLLALIPSRDPRHAELQAAITRAEQRALLALPARP